VNTGRNRTVGVADAPTGGLALLEPNTDHNGPAWLTGARRAAADWVGAHGFPTPKDEDWRYTRLEPSASVVAVP